MHIYSTIIRFRYYLAGFLSVVFIVFLSIYIVNAVTGQAPSITPADNWANVSLGVDPTDMISDIAWNGLVNHVEGKTHIDFSMSGNQVTFTCTPTRQNFRPGVAPGTGVRGAIMNLYKNGGTPGMGVRAQLSTPAGMPLGIIFQERASMDSWWPMNTGETVVIPVDTNGYFACQTIPSGSRTDAVIQLTLLAYIY